jgi:hypothetical protein
MFMKPEMAKSGDHIRECIFGYYSKSVSIDTRKMNVRDVSGIVLGYFGLHKGRNQRLKAL